ncbi:MAG TPA: MFS transporter [Humisphaera sp.]|jgi:ACS family hexuronate transporter-like MFS transporter|nr:MFS transporter [Humisphaera sp.]
MANDNSSAALVDVPGVEPLQPESMQPATRFRWVILGLVFLGTTVNYMDRQVLGFLAPDLRDKYHLFTDAQFGVIQGAFAISYALGQAMSGRWLDWIGIRVGYALALAAWSTTSILHVVARTALGFSVVRVFLGVAESPNFPAAVKTLAEWFPKRERAIGMGVVNSGTVVGAILVPAVVPFLVNHFGWQSAFLVTGTGGLIWLILWIPIYRKPEEHPRVSPAELALIRSDPPDPTRDVPWLSLLSFPQTWAFMIGKFITDPLWWFYMSWFPSYLKKQHDLNITKMGIPLIVIYLMASAGSMAGGLLSSAMMKRGYGVNVARKTAMLICALAILPVMYVTHVHELWGTVLMLGLATAAHQGFSSNLYTLVPDMFPKQVTASVSGLGGTFGYGGASLFSVLTGLIVGKWTNGNYGILFLIASTGYLVAFIVIQILAPRLEPAIVDTAGAFPVILNKSDDNKE